LIGKRGIRVTTQLDVADVDRLPAVLDDAGAALGS
jgi:hypothetical protein